MGEAAAVRVVDALLGDGEDALVGEEELLDGPVGRCVSSIGRVSLEVRAVKGRDAALGASSATRHGRAAACERTHMVVACPQQLLGRVEGEGRDGHGREMWTGGWELDDC